MSLLTDLEQIEHRIPLATAVEMITSFRLELPAMVQPAYSNSLPFAETFNKSVFEELILEEGCIGIRAYFGLDVNKNVRLIFVGVNDDNRDILPQGAEGESEPAIFEYGQRCPPICSEGPLNPAV